MDGSSGHSAWYGAEHDAMSTDATALERLFLAGRHVDVLKASVDSPEGDFHPRDTFAVVGALVFVGRQDEAHEIVRGLERDLASPAAAPRALEPEAQRALAASRFFLLVGECRAGRYGAAEALVKKNLPFYRSEDAYARFYASQGAGIWRYFRGSMARAALHAARARAHAMAARFSYGRMLALDLLGHALTQTGQVHAGIAILEQGAELASAIGLPELAATTRSSIMTYRARLGIGSEDAVTLLRRHLAEQGEADRYSRRMVLTELAMAHAFRGASVEAQEWLERAVETALPDGDRRARVRLALARAATAGLAQGEAAAIEFLDAARALMSFDSDPALGCEIMWVEHVVAPTRFAAHAPARIAKIARETGIARAAFMAQALGADIETTTEDAFAELVTSMRSPTGSIAGVFSRRMFGLLPQALGLAPGRRVYVDAVRALLIVEDNGNVAALELPGAAMLSLLHAIANGPQSKESLIKSVWNLNVYRPEKHDAVVHTAISRLRAALGPRGVWVRSTEQGYALASGVALLALEGRTVHPIVAVGPNATEAELGAAPPKKSRDADRKDAILRLAHVRGSVATKEVADELKISEMTAFRLLSGMAGEGLLTRVGQGRSTRYRGES